MNGMKTAFAALLLAATAAPAFAAPANVAAAVAAKDRSAEAVKLDESRKPAEVLKFLGLKQGDRALDLFTGSGYYAELMARAVGPKGMALGWEPSNFLDDKGRAAFADLKTRVPNFGYFAAPANAFTLPPNAFDFVMMHLNYHDLYWESAKYKLPRTDPDAFLKTVYSAVKPGGVVGIVDHAANAGGDTREVVDKLHRIDPAVIRADFERAGFKFDGESSLLRNPADDHSKLVFDPSIRGKTDRVVYRFRKPAR